MNPVMAYMAPARVCTRMMVLATFTRYVGGLRVRTYGKHVLAERGLVPDEPHQSDDEAGVPYIVGNGNAADLQDASGNEVLEGLVQSGEGLSVVAVDHDVHQQDTVYDQLGRQGYDEGMQVKPGYEETVYQSYQGSYSRNDQDYQRDGNYAQVREDLGGVVYRLQKGGGDTPP